MRIVLLDEPPGSVDPAWEDVVEVSVTVPPGADVSWLTWAVEESGRLTLPPDAYRVRVSARGRDEGQANEFAPAPVDFYLIQLWSAAARADAIIRTTSQDAAYWHQENGGRY